MSGAGGTRTKRRKAREVAMQALYQLDLNSDAADEAIEELIAERIHDNSVEELARELIAGVSANRDAIDRLLAKAAQNWSVRRMPAVDRNVMRIAVYEIRFAPETPNNVAINEAIEVSRRFGSGDSSSFVNGVLDKIAKMPADAEEDPAADDHPAEAIAPAPPEDSPEPAASETNPPSADEPVWPFGNRETISPRRRPRRPSNDERKRWD